MKPTDRTGSDPWIRFRGNLYDRFFRRKPKDKPLTQAEMENILMTLKMNELMPFIKQLIADFNDARGLIVHLTGKIADIESELSAERALMEEVKSLIMATREPGGSTGNM